MLQGVRLEAEASAVREWLGSPAAAPALALVAAARNAGGQHEALAEAEADRDARCRRALHAVQVTLNCSSVIWPEQAPASLPRLRSSQQLVVCDTPMATAYA